MGMMRPGTRLIYKRSPSTETVREERSTKSGENQKDTETELSTQSDVSTGTAVDSKE